MQSRACDTYIHENIGSESQQRLKKKMCEHKGIKQRMKRNIILLYKAMICMYVSVVAALYPKGNVLELEKSSEMVDGDN